MPEEKYNSFKNLAYLVFSVLLVVGIYQVVSIFGVANDPVNTEISSNAFFKPQSLDSQDRSLIGVVKAVPQSDNVRYAYGLYSEDGKLLAYLSSSKIDFALSNGLKIEAKGVYNVNSILGYAIIDVVSVKLK